MIAPLDRALVERLREGDAAAFDQAYAAYAARLYRFLLRLCRSRHAAEDVLQETWLKLSMGAGRLSPDTDLVRWLLTVARNAWISRTRAERRWVELLRAEELVDARESPETAAVAGSELARVEQALDGLGDADREVLLLVGVEGLTPGDAARVLGLTDVALRKRLSRGRQRLVAALGARPSAGIFSTPASASSASFDRVEPRKSR